jgi:O-antigen/teichoic acid export membrane protein
MVINTIAVSTFSSFSLLYSEQKNREGIHEYTIHYFSLIRILLLFSLTLIFLIGQDFVKIWVGLDKFGGNLILGLICITTLTDQLRMMLAQQYYATGKFNLTSITDSIFAVSFMIIAYFLIPYLKLEGIVLAGLLANVIYFVCCFSLEKRNNVNMVPHIINKPFFYDLLLFLFAIAVTKYIYGIYSGNISVEVIIVAIAFTVLCLIFYLKEKILFSFILNKFRRKSIVPNN